MSRLALNDRRNTIVGVIGRKGSGKSHLIATAIGPQFPRRITLDWTGEAREQYPAAIEAEGIAAVYETIAECSALGDRWHVIALVEPDECAPLFHSLAPIGTSKTRSISAALHGVAVECGEIDVIAPVSGAGKSARAVHHAVARGRHHRLSIIWGTQRPHQCMRILTAQSDRIISFRMHEARDLKYLRDTCSADFAKIVHRTLPKYWRAEYESETGTITVFNDDNKVVRVHKLEDGTELAGAPRFL